MQGSSTHRKILRRGADDFTSSPKEGVLHFYRHLISIALGRVEPANLGSNGNHFYHYTTEDNYVRVQTMLFLDHISQLYEAFFSWEIPAKTSLNTKYFAT
jgi:hypothetical protein